MGIRCHPLQNLQKLPKCQITHLAPPESLHRLEIEGFKAEECVPRLLGSEGFVLLGLFDLGGAIAFIFVFEEQLMGVLNPLTDSMHGLRTRWQPPRVPFPAVGDVFL